MMEIVLTQMDYLKPQSLSVPVVRVYLLWSSDVMIWDEVRRLDEHTARCFGDLITEHIAVIRKTSLRGGMEPPTVSVAYRAYY